MPGRFGVIALAAGNNVEALTQQILRHHPELVSVATPAVAANLAERLRAAGVAKLPEIQHGTPGMIATNALSMIIAVMMFTNTGASSRRRPTPFS